MNHVASTTLTSKGQMTLPKSMRDGLGVQSGDKLMLFLENGVVTVRSTREVIESLAGSLKPKVKVDFNDKKAIREGMAAAITEHYKNSFNIE